MGIIIKNSQIFLLIGALAFFVALFPPALSVVAQNPMMGFFGSASYFEPDEVFGLILLILSVGTMILVFLKKIEFI